MADNKNLRLIESELNARYTAAAYRFARIANWREYIELADEFRVLDTYKDSAQMYAKCIKAASAPAYRETTEKMASMDSPTAEDFREAARIMQLIQDYQDAREVMRVYTIKANALAYDEALALVSNSDATTAELERGVELLRSIKTFRNARDLLERYEKYYFERMYAEASHLEENGHVYSEFEEAAALFEKIAAYSDAAEHAAACRKRANKLRPKSKKASNPKEHAKGDEETRERQKGKPKGESEEKKSPDETIPPRRRKRTDDETRSLLSEVWQTMDKRRMGGFIAWVVLFLADVYASIVLPGLNHEFFQKYANETRAATTVVAIFAVVMGARAFVRMLTASMRQKLRTATLRALKKMAEPILKAVNKMLLSIGIDLSRRGRLGGRDEKSFVFNEEEKPKKVKKRLKNELKWQDQTDNAARVRFIFIDYMIRRIKNGYKMKRHMTPAEIGAEIAVENDEQNLFAIYDKARYAGANGIEEITDGMVGELQLVNQKRST